MYLLGGACLVISVASIALNIYIMWILKRFRGNPNIRMAFLLVNHDARLKSLEKKHKPKVEKSKRDALA